VGCADRMQYTALGAAVNLASRVEALNKHFGTEMLVTGAVEESVRDRFVFRPLGLVVASGTTVPVPLFELVGAAAGAPHAASPAELAHLTLWQDAFSAYMAADWPGAAAAFRAYLAQRPDDAAGRLLLDRTRANAAAGTAEFAIHFTEK